MDKLTIRLRVSLRLRPTICPILQPQPFGAVSRAPGTTQTPKLDRDQIRGGFVAYWISTNSRARVAPKCLLEATTLHSSLAGHGNRRFSGSGRLRGLDKFPRSWGREAHQLLKWLPGPQAALTPTINGSQARLKMNAESLLPTTIWVHPERTSCYLGPPPKYMLKLHRTQNIGVMGNTCQAELCAFTSKICSSGGSDFVTLPLRARWQCNVTNSFRLGHTG